MEKIRISLEKNVDESYDLVIGENLFPLIASDLRQKNIASNFVILTDTNLESKHGVRLLEEMKSKGLETFMITYPAGEKNKTRETKARIEDKMFELGLGRDTALVALGGGVCGDMGGFIAATYMRGIPVVQVPTSTVAQTDSSVGGKTAIDVPAGKNLIGCFHQPNIVYIDVTTLKSLPEREYRSGLVELVKHGIIADEKFLQFFKENEQTIMGKEGAKYNELMVKLLAWNSRIKAKVVKEDEKEKGVRKILNYGHTVAHSVEKLMGYELTHGECVSIGIVAAANISKELGFLKEKDVLVQEKVLSEMGVPTRIPKKLDIKEIITLMDLDKKAREKKAEFVLLEGIAKVKSANGNYAMKVPEEIVEKVLSELKES